MLQVSAAMNSVEARRIMAVVDDTLDSLRCKASIAPIIWGLSRLTLLARVQSNVPRYRRSTDRRRAVVWHSWPGQTIDLTAVGQRRRC